MHSGVELEVGALILVLIHVCSYLDLYDAHLEVEAEAVAAARTRKEKATRFEATASTLMQGGSQRR